MEEAMFASCYGKALGLLKALHWMIDGGHSNVIFELNCKVIVDRINGLGIDNYDLGFIILQC